MYKKGTHKVNLGLSQEDWDKLVYIGRQNETNIADTVRYAIDCAFGSTIALHSTEVEKVCNKECLDAIQDVRRLLNDMLAGVIK